MNFEILSAEHAQLSEIEEIARRPAFRKATRNIALATAVLEKALKPLSTVFEQEQSQFSLVLTSETGELETTFDFLKTLHEVKLARPLLFQNSLHNTTAGFLSIQFGLTAPVLTSSSSPFGCEQALEIASMLLSQKQCRYCIVLSVDIWPKLKGYQKADDILFDGASCLILSLPSSRPISIRPLAQLIELQITSEENLFKSEPSSKLWEPLPLSQNFLDRLVYQVKLQPQGRLSMNRPGFGVSTATWQEARL